MDPAAQALFHAQDARGRPPTRGELRTITETDAVGSLTGGYLLHTAWTYWGHSGAPLFCAEGAVRSLHCAWNDRTGMRHGQKLEHIHAALAKCRDGGRKGGGKSGGSSRAGRRGGGKS